MPSRAPAASSSVWHSCRFPVRLELEGVAEPCALSGVEERQGCFDVMLVPGCLRARLEQQDYLRSEVRDAISVGVMPARARVMLCAPRR